MVEKVLADIKDKNLIDKEDTIIVGLSGSVQDWVCSSSCS